MKQSGNVILGSATGYDVSLICPFVFSLTKTNFDGTLVLIIYKEQLVDFEKKFKDIKEFNIKYQITEIGKFKSKSKYSGFYKYKLVKQIVSFFVSLSVNETDKNSKIKALNIVGFPHVSRFFEYQKFLKENNNITNVLLTDVRDVIFQDNPFTHLEQKLYVGMENPNYTIGTESYNKKWILDAYGEVFFNEAKDKQISCSGVTIGDVDSIGKYIEKMIEEFVNQPYKKMSNRIYDQAMHNKLIICNELENIFICQPFLSSIVTLGLYSIDDISRNTEGLVISKENKIIPIVHQYDRHPQLVSFYQEYLSK